MKKIIWTVDAQKDFVNKDGMLSVDGVENIRPNIKTIMDFGLNNNMELLGSMDAHTHDDVEFEQHPPHCIVDMEGQELIPECVVSHTDNIYYIPNNGNGIDMNVFEGAQQLYFEKQTTDVWDKCLGQPDNIQTILRMLDVTDVYITGVASNICVMDAVRGFVKRKYRVHIITDAIKGINIPENPSHPINEEKALEEMKELGCRFMTTDEFIKECD